MELLRPGEEFLAAYDPRGSVGASSTSESYESETSDHYAESDKVSAPEYFVFNLPPGEPGYDPSYPPFTYPTTPMTPLTPSADVPGSPFDVYTSYRQFKQPEFIEQQPGPPAPHPSPSGPSEYTVDPGYPWGGKKDDPLPSCSFPTFCPGRSEPAHYFSTGEPTATLYTNDVPRPPFLTPFTGPECGYALPPPALPPHRSPYHPPSGPYPSYLRDQHQHRQTPSCFVLDNTLTLQAEEAHHQGQYDRVLQVLGSHFFDKAHHEQLQHLWLAAVYAKESAIKRKTLTAVDRYRLRKRNPFPSSISDGEKTIYCLKKSARDSLTNFFEGNPYPTPTEKRRLANGCDLSYVQISNWFKNKRMREKESNRLK